MTTKLVFTLAWRVIQVLINRRRRKKGLPPLNWEVLPYTFNIDYLLDSHSGGNIKHDTFKKKRAKKNA
jgi:hypothetical protein